jgi:hypothetical protein
MRGYIKLERDGIGVAGEFPERQKPIAEKPG